MARRDKRFRIPAEEIKPLAPGRGACIASDRITVEGRKIGFMYREHPDFDADSGWRFLSGDETDAYMEDVDNHAVYEVNTLANYDPDIIPFLDAPAGSAFERRGGAGRFVEVEFEMPED